MRAEASRIGLVDINVCLKVVVRRNKLCERYVNLYISILKRSCRRFHVFFYFVSQQLRVFINILFTFVNSNISLILQSE